jgi:glycosyltransferase involved in cell wall biosynthesis
MLSDGRPGGAHVAAFRLKKALAEANTAVRWLTADPAEGSDEALSQWPVLLPYLAYRLACYGIRNPRQRERFRRRVLELTLARRLRELNPAVINLHNVHGHFTGTILGALPRTAAVIWTLHDMWPLTGYCCHSLECQDYARGCTRDCPQLGKWGPVFRSPGAAWRAFEKFFQANASRLAFVTPSEWLAGVARQRLGPGFRVTCIPNSLNVDGFTPSSDRKAVRRALNLPEDVPIVLTGAHWAQDPLKGFKFLEEAIKLLRQTHWPRIKVVLLGEGQPSAQADEAWIYRGFIRDERLMNLYYNAADLYVLPSLADNLPNTLLESQSAGTPCVAFDVGGCRETFEEGVTGHAVTPHDSVALAGAIGRILGLNPTEWAAWSQRSRERALARYSPALQARQYQLLADDIRMGRRP